MTKDFSSIANDPKTASVTISEAVYDQLVHDAEKLRCLEAAGVDNWDGYDYAMELLYGESND